MYYKVGIFFKYLIKFVDNMDFMLGRILIYNIFER